MNYFDNLISLKKESDRLQAISVAAQSAAGRATNEFNNERSKKLQKSLLAVKNAVLRQLDGDWYSQAPGAKLSNDIVVMMLVGDLLHFKRLKLNVSLNTGVISAKITDVDPVSITYLKSKMQHFSKEYNWYLQVYNFHENLKDLNKEQISCLTDANYDISSYLQKRLD